MVVAKWKKEDVSRMKTYFKILSGLVLHILGLRIDTLYAPPPDKPPPQTAPGPAPHSHRNGNGSMASFRAELVEDRWIRLNLAAPYCLFKGGKHRYIWSCNYKQIVLFTKISKSQ